MLDEARRGAPEGTVAVADHQTAGRGRLSRTWEAPAGASLLTSILLRPDLAPDRRHLVTAAVALAGAIAIAVAEPQLKWPNDLLIGSRKVAGVLAEVDGDAVVVGIGINLNWDGDPPANGIAVNQVVGHAVDRDAVLDALLAALDERYGNWADVASEYRSSCSTLHRAVRVEMADETFTGVAADVSDDGHLLVDVGSCLRTVSAADVVHLR
ncbi:MAG: biotin--[acetyl-CoA-carboxylase] ligase [Actinobacteria bacterium]|nr:biotin--[acetyl-CoA-carboxylase] ligase [Actinomycetota bacterium]